MKNSFYLGIDVGTSSIKIIALNLVDKSTKKVRQPYASTTLKGMKNAFKKALCLLSMEINLKEVKALSFSSQVGTYIIDNKEIIPWYSNAGKEELEYIKSSVDKETFIKEISFNHPDIISYPLPRLIYIKNHYENVHSVMMPKTFFIKELTGNFYSDVYSGRGIVNQTTGQYSKTLLEKFDLDDLILPSMKNITDLAGNVSETSAKKYGLSTHCKVYLGCNDFYAGLMGMGIYQKGVCFELAGTSEHIGTINDDYRNNGGVETPYLGGIVNYGGTKSSGSSCRMAKELFGQKEIVLEDILKEKPPIYLPYLNGERAPIYDEHAKGVFFGIRDSHTKKHFQYSMLEGVVFSLFDIYQSLNIKADKLICAGGGTENPLLIALKSILFDVEVINCYENDSSALGACLLALVGNHEFPSLEEAISDIVLYKTNDIRNTNNSEIRQTLLKRFELYKQTYSNLKNSFKNLEEI